MSKTWPWFFLLGIGYLTLLAGAKSQATSMGLQIGPCAIGRTRVVARCGTLSLPENPSHPDRLIAIHIEILPARYESHRAIAVIPGGPGQAASEIAPMVADGAFEKPLLALRDHYDILFVDLRGMGLSNPFGCDFTDAKDPGSYFRQLWPDRIVKQCRQSSSLNHDPSLYNTNHAVDDLDAVRGALGYPKLVLDGGSYGTFFSFVYIRRHPAHVESTVLDGVYAPGFQPLPGSPDGAQAALNDLIRRCQDDKMCRTHFPDFGAHFNAVIRRFDHGPIPVPVTISGNRQSLWLSKEVLVDRVRQALYDPENAAYIPVVFEHAYDKDYGPLGDLVNGMSLALAKALDWGAFLSYTCADEIPLLSESDMRAASQQSFVGDLRARAQQRACRLWKVPSMPPSFNEPVRSGLPILMIMGSDDPTTPPKYARRELPFLSDATAIVVRGAGHTTETACTDRLVEQFVRAGSEAGFATSSCRTAYTPPVFALHP